MNNSVFGVNTLASTTALKNALHDKLLQIKALVECIRLVATTHELDNGLVYDAIWAIANKVRNEPDMDSRHYNSYRSN